MDYEFRLRMRGNKGHGGYRNSAAHQDARGDVRMSASILCSMFMERGAAYSVSGALPHLPAVRAPLGKRQGAPV